MKRKLSDEGSMDMGSLISNGNGSVNGSVAGDGTKKKRKVDIVSASKRDFYLISFAIFVNY